MRKFAILLALGSATLMAADMTTLTISVKNIGEKPVDRASVIVDFAGEHVKSHFGKKTRYHWELRTNQNGLAKIPPIPQGKIRVQVIASSYQTFGQIFEVQEEVKTIPVTLSPPQPQYSAH